MAITATNNGAQRQLTPAGNYIARCYQMIHIGTIEDSFMGQPKKFNKVRIGWELPTELRVFKPENGEQPSVITKEFTLSMHEKSNLRKMLASWRGKDFTEEEAKSFDITRLLGIPCFLNLIHKPNKENTKLYEEVASISPLPKGVTCPPQINNTLLWDYDTHDYEIFNQLPDFIKADIQRSEEYKKLHAPQETAVNNNHQELEDELPF